MPSQQNPFKGLFAHPRRVERDFTPLYLRVPSFPVSPALNAIHSL